MGWVFAVSLVVPIHSTMIIDIQYLQYYYISNSFYKDDRHSVISVLLVLTMHSKRMIDIQHFQN